MDRIKELANMPYSGKEIKKKLVELNMTQRKLAEKVNVSENYLTDILRGRRSGKKYMEKIINILAIKL